MGQPKADAGKQRKTCGPQHWIETRQIAKTNSTKCGMGKAARNGRDALHHHIGSDDTAGDTYQKSGGQRALKKSMVKSVYYLTSNLC